MKRITDLFIWILVFALAPFALLFYLSQNALPGDFFYPAKRGMEDVLLAGASLHPSAKAFLHADLAGRRYSEAERLLLARADTAGLTNLVTEIESSQAALDEISDVLEKERLKKKLIEDIETYQNKLTFVQSQVQATQKASDDVINTKVSNTTNQPKNAAQTPQATSAPQSGNQPQIPPQQNIQPTNVQQSQPTSPVSNPQPTVQNPNESSPSVPSAPSQSVDDAIEHAKDELEKIKEELKEEKSKEDQGKADEKDNRSDHESDEGKNKKEKD